MASRWDAGGGALPEWRSGTALKGKWTGIYLIIEKRLGTGANGSVYLARTLQGPVAVKVCRTAGEAAMEWGLLDRLRAAGGAFPRPVVIDDESATGAYFYAMEWVAGDPLDRAVSSLSRPQVRSVLTQLGTALAALHRTGHAFCDIKPQNILVRMRPIEARLVDVGGVTPFGRLVRQFTPFYDRAFWDLGSRRADPHYDVCGLALAIILAYAGSPPASLLQSDPATRRRWLQWALSQVPWPDVAGLLRWALTDPATRAGDLAQRIAALPDALPGGPPRRAARAAAASSAGSGVTAARTRAAATRQPHFVTAAGTRPARSASSSAGAFSRRTGRRPRMDWTERLMWSTLTLAAATTALAWLAVTGWF